MPHCLYKITNMVKNKELEKSHMEIFGPWDWSNTIFTVISPCILVFDLEVGYKLCYFSLE